MSKFRKTFKLSLNTDCTCKIYLNSLKLITHLNAKMGLHLIPVDTQLKKD